MKCKQLDHSCSMCELHCLAGNWSSFHTVFQVATLLDDKLSFVMVIFGDLCSKSLIQIWKIVLSLKATI